MYVFSKPTVLLYSNGLRAEAGADFVYFFVHFDNNKINAGWQV